MAEEYDMDVTICAHVNSISRRMEKSGFAVGDVITHIDGQQLDSHEAKARLMPKIKIKGMMVRIMRNGKRGTVKIEE